MMSLKNEGVGVKNISDDALRLKNDGNILFFKGDYLNAIKNYDFAIDLFNINTSSAPQDNNSTVVKNIDGNEGLFIEDNSLQAVLFSNRSACYFELGKYQESILDAKACIAVVDENQLQEKEDLLCKNLWRLARALHYRGGREDVTVILQRLEKTSNSSYTERASKMINQLSYYKQMREDGELSGESNKSSFHPTPIRTSLQSPYTEYYKFGHDVAESAFRQEDGADDEENAIILKDLPQEELSSLSFLFGGVGDGRHVLTTIMDANRQYVDTLNSSQQEAFRLHFTLNDINVQLLAKDLLVLALSHAIGGLAPDLEALYSRKEPLLLGLVIMYTTLGYAMPPVVYDEFVQCVKKWFVDNTHEQFSADWPCFPITKETWGAIVNGPMLAWVDPDGPEGYDPKLPSTRSVLENYNPDMKTNKKESLDNAMKELGMFGGNTSHMFSNIASVHNEALDRGKEKQSKMLEMAATMDLSPDMIAMVKAKCGDDLTDDQTRKKIVDMIGEMNPLELQSSGTGTAIMCPLDGLFLELTHVMLPPLDETPIEELNSEMKTLRDKSSTRDKKVIMRTFRIFRETIYDTWKVNPVLFDPSYHHFLLGQHVSDKVNPVEEFPSLFYTRDAQSYMTVRPPKPFTKEAMEEFLYKSVTRYYWNVGNALKNLDGKIVVEFSLGSIVELGSQIAYQATNRISRGLPIKYQRIFLSNVPDYIGLLSCFVTVAPLLSDKSCSVIPSMRSNTLLNTGLWKTYDEYVYSTVACTYKEVDLFLGLRVIDKEPSVWNGFVAWTHGSQSQSESEQPRVRYEDFRLWLHRLYLAIILPPDRDTFAMLREERSSTVDLFLMICAKCINELGYPVHFVSCILDELLGTKPSAPLKTKALLTNDSPASASQLENHVNKYNLSAFRLELANQISIFMENDILKVKVICATILPVPKASCYKLKIEGIEKTHSYTFGMIYGRSSSPCLGFLLYKKKISDYGISSGASEGGGNHMMAMMAMMSGGNGQRKVSKLRKVLLDSGDAIGHIFSSMQWNIEESIASFYMCDDVFERYKDYGFVLIRTDGWFCIDHNDIKLGNAKRFSNE